MTDPDDRHQFKLLIEHTETEGSDYHEWVDVGRVRDDSVDCWRKKLYGDEPYEIVLDAIGRRRNGGLRGGK